MCVATPTTAVSTVTPDLLFSVIAFMLVCVVTFLLLHSTIDRYHIMLQFL